MLVECATKILVQYDGGGEKDKQTIARAHMSRVYNAHGVMIHIRYPNLCLVCAHTHARTHT